MMQLMRLNPNGTITETFCCLSYCFDIELIEIHEIGMLSHCNSSNLSLYCVAYTFLYYYEPYQSNTIILVNVKSELDDHNNNDAFC